MADIDRHELHTLVDHIPESDVPKLTEMGVARVFGPGTSLPDIVAFLQQNTRRAEPSDA